MTESVRRLTVGAELQQGGGAHVRVWGPHCKRIDLVTPAAGGAPERTLPMAREADGHFSVFDAGGARGRTVLVPARR